MFALRILCALAVALVAAAAGAAQTGRPHGRVALPDHARRSQDRDFFGPYHSFHRADAEPLVPGRLAELRFALLPTSALIRRGHRIRIAIAGADRGTFARIPARGNPAITVARNSAHASRIDLPVMVR
jgi:hypothetical protein